MTYAVIRLGLNPGLWHGLWMLIVLMAVGLLLNRGAARIVMAALLSITSWVVVSIVGGAMGGV